jgi:hypothetical protein
LNAEPVISSRARLSERPRGSSAYGTQRNEDEGIEDDDDDLDDDELDGVRPARLGLRSRL